jgi:hypothetical protein
VFQLFRTAIIRNRLRKPKHVARCGQQTTLKIQPSVHSYNRTGRLPLSTQLIIPSRYSDSLRDGRSGDRITVYARFSASFQTNRENPPTLRVSFTGVKRLGRGVNHQPPPSAEVKERLQIYLYCPSGPTWPVLGRTLPLPTAEYEET